MIFVLDNKEKMVGVLNNKAPLSCPYYDDIHIENLETGVNTYEFYVPANHATSEVIEEEGYVIFKDLDEKMQMFKITEVEDDSEDRNEKRVYCEHIAIPELLSEPFRPQKLIGYTLQDAMRAVLQNTGWQLGEVGWEGVNDLTFEDYTNSLEAMYTVLEAYDVEVQYEVKFRNGEVTERLVHVKQKIGSVTNKRFTYGKDLVGVKRRVNSEGIVTALIGLGKGDNEGNRLTLSNYDPDTDGQKDALPDGFEKPYSADWVGSLTALQEYGKKGKHRIGIFIDDTAENVETLLANTLKELKVRMKPKVTYEMKVAMLERVAGLNPEVEKTRIGDTIIADEPTFRPRLVLEARIIEMKRSYTRPENDECTLGDYRPIKISNNPTIARIQKLISQSEEKWNAISYIISVHSTGGDTFKNGEGTTTLTAKVHYADKEVDAAGTEYVYKWYKYDKTGKLITNWHSIGQDYKLGKSITLTNADVDDKATFSVIVETK